MLPDVILGLYLAQLEKDVNIIFILAK